MEAIDSPPSTDGVRLVGADRVLAVLKELAGHPDGVSLDDLTRAMGSPKRQPAEVAATTDVMPTLRSCDSFA